MRTFLLLAFLCVAPLSEAQVRTHLFYEAGGPAGWMSGNIELNVANYGIRAGLGTAFFFFTAPVTVSRFYGEGWNKLEVGAGATFIVETETDQDSDIFGNFTQNSQVFAGTAILGYRLQPNRGLVLRLFYSPLFTPDAFLNWGGASVGIRL